MEIPDLIKQRLGGEAVESAVNLGDEDLVCFTAERTLIYRADGLLSDESVDVYDHDIERLDVSEGRRKTAFELTYYDRTESFSVARDRAKPVLKRLLAGVLHASGVTDDDETVVDVFRFSELTVIVTDSRLVKHIGASVWEEDYAEYPFAEVTGLEFEEGSVATQIVLSVSGRPQRIKAPSDEGRLVRKQLEKALFAFYDVDSIDQLNAAIGADDPGEEGNNRERLDLDDTISPLVGGDDTEEESETGLLGSESGEIDDPLDDTPERPAGEAEEERGDDTDEGTATDTEDGKETPTADSTEVEAESAKAAPEEREEAESMKADPEEREEAESAKADAEEPEDEGAERDEPGTRQPGQAVDPAEIQEIQNQLSTLTEAVSRQNELLEKQHETIEQLIEELRKQQ